MSKEKIGKVLSEKPKSFCREYVIHFNGTKAYQKVYGGSEKVAGVNASRLLGNAKVQAYLVTLIKKQTARSEKSADDVIDHLTKIAFSNLKDFVKWDKNGVQIKSSGSKKVDGTLLTEVSETITENTTNKHIKLKDGLKALELLGKHFGLFEDKLRVVNDDLHITVIMVDLKHVIIQVQQVIAHHVSDPKVRDRIARELKEIEGHKERRKEDN